MWNHWRSIGGSGIVLLGRVEKSWNEITDIALVLKRRQWAEVRGEGLFTEYEVLCFEITSNRYIWSYISPQTRTCFFQISDLIYRC
jgi:hypothetical protein